MLRRLFYLLFYYSRSISKMQDSFGDKKVGSLDRFPEIMEGGFFMPELSREKTAFVDAVCAIKDNDAYTAKAIGYMPKTLIDTTLPHRQPVDSDNRPLSRFTRKNGRKTLSMASTYEEGLPFGTIPRLLFCLIATQAVVTKKREIVLGKSLADVIKKIELTSDGRTVGRVKHQIVAMLSTLITYRIEREKKDQMTQDLLEYLGKGRNIAVADEWQLYWSSGDKPSTNSKHQCSLVLSEQFYEEIVKHAVPVDTRALAALSRSPMAMDIYCWLTWRYFNLKKPTLVPWAKLVIQFGADYDRLRDFKRRFLDQLEKVRDLYPKAIVFSTEKGIILKPSPTHVPQIHRR